MDLAALVRAAAARRASDLHLEPGSPPTLRVRGELVPAGDAPCRPDELLALARALLSPDELRDFAARRSADLSRVLAGSRCRINVLHGTRGVGLAVRLLSDRVVSIRNLNLHPDFEQFVAARHGLVLVSGPTGSGKSSTLAALLHHLNARERRHVVTIEQPVEYALEPRECLIRQREVGRDTPSFEQAIHDALREDIDVLMVGEMRARDTMRLTLDACETGHLVLSTVHAGTTIEALQRMVAAFPAEEQPSVCHQIAGSLVAVVAQRLRWRDDLGIRVPECEILRGTNPVRSMIRQGQLFKLQMALETGAAEGLWTFDRYARWLDERADFVLPEQLPRAAAPPGRDHGDGGFVAGVPGPGDVATGDGGPVDMGSPDEPVAPLDELPPLSPDVIVGDDDAPSAEDVIVIQPDERELRDLLKDLEDEEGPRPD